jgi:uncharacterized protein (TIGR02246 family)
MRFLMFAAVLASPALAQTPADETAVRDLVTKYMDARDKRDPEAIRALFTEDADQFTTGGEWRRGRDNLVRGTIESSTRNPGTRRITVETVRFPTTGVAIVDGGYTITNPQGGAPRSMWTTLVMTKGSAGWRIAAIRNAAPTAAPQAR